jgi:S1-C subfamily serine protease
MTMTRGRALCVAGVAAALCVAGVAAAALLPAAPDHASAPPRVVAVAVTSPAGAAELATGFAAGRDRVVTVAHVLDAGGAVTVDGRRARVLRIDRRDDLALLAVSGVRAARARIAQGTGSVRVLLPGRARPARIRRAIRATVRIEPAPPVRRPALELAADVAPGDSGAPVVDARGRVAGVVFATSSGRAHTAYAVDAAALATLLRNAS